MKMTDLPATQLELFDNVADLLEAVDVSVLPSNGMSDDEKRCSLEEQHLIGVQDAGEVAKTGLKLVDVGNQQVDNV